jgi:hypothetical protein
MLDWEGELAMAAVVINACTGKAGTGVVEGARIEFRPAEYARSPPRAKRREILVTLAERGSAAMRAQ